MSGLIEYDGEHYRVLNGYAYHVENGLNYFEPTGELEAVLREHGYSGPIRNRIERFHAYGYPDKQPSETGDAESI